MSYTVKWTARAKYDVQAISDFILIHWEPIIVSRFLDLVEDKIEFILENPHRYNATKHFTNARKVIVHKHVTLFYTIDEELKEIILLSFFDTRQNPNKLK